MLSNDLSTTEYPGCNGVDGNLQDNPCSSAQSWVSSVAVCRGSDLAASGAGNGVVRLWAIESETATIQPLHNLPLVSHFKV